MFCPIPMMYLVDVNHFCFNIWIHNINFFLDNCSVIDVNDNYQPHPVMVFIFSLPDIKLIMTCSENCVAKYFCTFTKCSYKSTPSPIKFIMIVSEIAAEENLAKTLRGIKCCVCCKFTPIIRTQTCYDQLQNIQIIIQLSTMVFGLLN